MGAVFNVQATEEIEKIEKATIELEVLSSVAGAKADSIYQIAVRNGYQGTEQEFLEEYVYSGKGGFYNLDTMKPITGSFYTLETAVAAVAADETIKAKQRNGLIIQFFDGTAWRYYAYQLTYLTGDASERAQFADTSNWLETDGNTVFFQEGVSPEEMEDEYTRILEPLYQALEDASTEIERTKDATSDAEDATSRANAAATNAGNKAAAAENAASDATTKGNYAKQQGDYAKEKADEIEDARGTYPTLGARINALNTEIELVQDVIPSQASTSNQLADKEFVNSSIATSTATYRGNYNLVTDLSLTVSATQSQIASALASKISQKDNNDYCFVQIPTSDSTPSEIARVDRYKYNGTEWSFEYSLNNSSFTAEQWAAINSGITTSLVDLIQSAIQPSDISDVAVFVEDNSETFPF